MLKTVLILLISLYSSTITAFTVSDPELTKNANSIILDQTTKINITSSKNMTTVYSETVLILNEKGRNSLDLSVYYSKATKVKSIKAEVLNPQYQNIKSFKKKDFQDLSTSQGFSISDYRVLEIDITQNTYPFIVVFEYETESSNTAFIPAFVPITAYNQSVKKASFELQIYDPNNLRFKEYNQKAFDIVSSKTNNSFKFSISDVPALRQEAFSPTYSEIVPRVRFSLNEFFLEGYAGKASTWKEFSSWMYTDFLKGTDVLPEKTISEIRSLTQNVSDPVEKARIVYQYMQNKTRYISVQLGVGGWKPMLASDVDRLGYGDCKALSNYTRALLKAVDVPSYYCVIYGGNTIRNMDVDFSALEGNHAVLALKDAKGNLIWMECTSQSAPFGHIANFTDNRYALIIDEAEGRIVKTTAYINFENSSKTSFNITLNPSGDAIGVFRRTNTGTYFSNVSNKSHLSENKKNDSYKQEFNLLNNFQVSNLNLTEDKVANVSKEQFDFKTSNFAKKYNNYLIIDLNPLIDSQQMINDSEGRKNDFLVSRGYADEFLITVNYPASLGLEELPKNENVSTEFGSYSLVFTKKENAFETLITFNLNQGVYPKEAGVAFKKYITDFYTAINKKIMLNQ